MYYFEAHYYNAENDAEITKKIVFDGQFFGNDKECYVYAMSKRMTWPKSMSRLKALN